MQKGFLSRSVKRFRQAFKKNLSLLVRLLPLNLSYTLFGIPKGLTSVSIVGCELKIFYPATSVTRKVPRHLGGELEWHFKERLASDLPDPHGLFVVKNGIATSTGGNLASNKRLFTTFLDKAEGRQPREHLLFQFSAKNFSPKVATIDSPLVTLAADWQGAFYHWMYEILPRLHLVEMGGYKNIPLLVDQSFSFQKESINALGYQANEVFATKKGFSIQAKELIVPSIPQRGSPHGWACLFLREKFLPKVTPRKERRKLYISRNDAKVRRVVNEEEVLPLLERHGYEKVTLAGLPFLEQVALFASASHIVAPHGAGLSHLAFAPPGTKVLELFSPSYVNVCYWWLSEECAIDYMYLIGQGDPLPEKDVDIHCNLRQLEKALEMTHEQ